MTDRPTSASDGTAPTTGPTSDRAMPSPPTTVQTLPQSGPGRICVISNTGSGRSSREADAVQQAMKVLGDQAELRAVEGPEIEPTARRAIEEDFDAIVAAGGDGTIMSVAGAVAGSGRRFGVIPLGTFNYFARGLGIPMEPDGAAEVIRAGASRHVDLAEVNGRIFLNNASFGLYPAILQAREEDYQFWGRRRLAAHWTTLKTVMAVRRPLHLYLTFDGEPVEVRTPLLFVARSAYQLNEFGLAGADDVEAGKFAAFEVPVTGRAGLLARAAKLMAGRMTRGSDFVLHVARDITLGARSRHLNVACDGEKFRMKLPLHFRILPDAIEVFAPATPAPAGAGSRE